MGNGEEGDDGDDEAEPSRPTVSDLAASLGGDSGGETVSGEEADDEARPSFADLILSLRGQRRGAAARTGGGESARGGSSEGAHRRGDDSADEVDWAWRQSGARAPADEFNFAAETEAILGLVEDATNVLLLGELLRPEEYDVCTKLLGAETPANLLLVTLSQSPEDRLNVCRGFLGELPGETVVVSVGDPSASETPARIPVDGDDVTVETIPDPSDLMRIGITISRKLSEFENNDVPTAVCFHSLTALLQFVGDRQAVFRFLHTLRGRVRAADARAHYHLDDGAHDREVVSLLRPLFDVTLRIDDDGTVSINPDA